MSTHSHQGGDTNGKDDDTCSGMTDTSYDKNGKTTIKKMKEDGIVVVSPKHNGVVEKKHSCEIMIEKRQSISQLSDRMKSYLLGDAQQRRQSLPPDIANALSPLQTLSPNGHFSASCEVYSCPGTPQRNSLASTHITPHITPSTSISSFVSSLDGSYSEENLFNDRSEENARICFEIEKYLESLADIELRDITPEPGDGDFSEEKSN